MKIEASKDLESKKINFTESMELKKMEASIGMELMKINARREIANQVEFKRFQYTLITACLGFATVCFFRNHHSRRLDRESYRHRDVLPPSETIQANWALTGTSALTITKNLSNRLTMSCLQKILKY